ncbi:phage portal protein [Chromobacterium phragmitis]|uniref:phage portal protein n=1 Tax=Chromobacterium amazonense TaxID=1382803 RepID=UPI0021B7EDA0|nr:phage portal protein [Chromobacterium amazonense]MBM2884088.1 phage portal protein [Chromobacterium amazonense]
MAKLIDNIKRTIGRLRKAPQRDTVPYATLIRLGQSQVNRNKPLPKPTPANLRAFSHTTYCRRAINGVKNRLIKLEWTVQPIPGVEKTPDIERQIAIVQACLARPNNDDTLRTLIEQVAEDFLVLGAGCYEQQPSSDPSRPAWMWPVDAKSIQIYPLWSGDPNEARYAQELGYGQLSQLRNDELVYIRANPTTANPFGWGPVEIAFRDISRLLSAQEQAGNVAGNATPSFMLAAIGADQSAVDKIRDYWTNEIEGRGKTPILGAETDGAGGSDIKAIPLHANNDSALFLEWQRLLIRTIALAFDLSPANLGEGSQNRATAEVEDERDMDSAVRPLATLIASHITRETIQGLMGFPLLQIAPVGLDRDDEKTAAEVYDIEYQCNAVTPNEYRARRGLPPLKSPIGEMTFAEVQAVYGQKPTNPPTED